MRVSRSRGHRGASCLWQGSSGERASGNLRLARLHTLWRARRNKAPSLFLVASPAPEPKRRRATAFSSGCGQRASPSLALGHRRPEELMSLRFPRAGGARSAASAHGLVAFINKSNGDRRFHRGNFGPLAD